MGGDKARRNVLKSARLSLDTYGARNTETITAAIERLKAEHSAAVAESNQLRAENAKLKADIELAKQGRTLAQQASNEMVALSRKFEADSIRVRKALEILLRSFPVTYSKQINEWIEADKKRWEASWK